ncbi:hypothetical protein Tco_0390813 [Tanacetum coccineum]
MDPHNKELRVEESRYIHDYVEAVKDAEKLLYQKAKIKWMKVGDKNDAYFHRVLKSRNHKSRINVVKDVQGNFFQGEEVAGQFVKHFNNFLGIEVPVKDFGPFLPLIRKKLSPTDADFIVREVCDEEINEALFQIDVNKDLGPDGYSFMHIQDNILLSQELFKGYDRKEGLKRVAMKIDIQKAYDTVNWKFLEDILKDDLLMFCYGDKGFVQTLKETIKEFGSVSGLKPNYDKSTIIFGSIKEEDKQDILECVPFKVEHLPIKYLGVPLTSKRICANNGKSLIDKIKNKASVFLLPKSVIYDINKLLKGFLWNQGDISTGKAKVAWNKICRPKSEGGLGLKDLGLRLEETGALQSFITHRDLYNVRWHDRMVVKDIVESDVCVWPKEWTRKYPDLAMNSRVKINNGKEDEIVWRLKNGKEDKFSIRRVYQNLCDNEDEACCKTCKGSGQETKVGGWGGSAGINPWTFSIPMIVNLESGRIKYTVHTGDRVELPSHCPWFKEILQDSSETLEITLTGYSLHTVEKAKEGEIVIRDFCAVETSLSLCCSKYEDLHII